MTTQHNLCLIWQEEEQNTTHLLLQPPNPSGSLLLRRGIVFMQQCNTKFFLKLETQDARALGEIFDLSPALVERIETFMPGQGILRMGKESGIVKFHGFPLEEEFLSSDPQAVALR